MQLLNFLNMPLHKSNALDYFCCKNNYLCTQVGRVKKKSHMAYLSRKTGLMEQGLANHQTLFTNPSNFLQQPY